MFARTMTLLYGIFSYLVFFATFLYAIGFIGDIFVPKSMDSGPVSGLGKAIIVDASLLGLFAIQHSLMARPWFKRSWTAIVPKAVERSTYVLLASLCLALLFWQWRPLGGSIWRVDSPIGSAILLFFFAAGWVIVLISTFLTSHLDLFGLRQVWTRFRNEKYVPLAFESRGLYRLVRHPLYVGWLFVFWFTPVMTAAHLLFSLLTTVYILLAIGFEEKDLVDMHGEVYLRYREEVPMLAPSLRRTRAVDYWERHN